MQIKQFPLYLCLLALSSIAFSCNDDTPDEPEDKVPLSLMVSLNNNNWGEE